MSTGLDCFFEEDKDGTWTYELEYSYEQYNTYGPFKTFEEAKKHLRANHPNPGGYSVGYYREDVGA